MTVDSNLSLTNGVSNSLPLQPSGPGSLEKQLAEALAQKYGDKTGKFSDQDLAAETTSVPATPPQSKPVEVKSSQPSEVVEEPAEDEDEFVKLFGPKKESESYEEDGVSYELPSELDLEEVAKTYKTTPEKLLESLRVKTKVGGDERNLALKEVIKGYQTDKFITQKSQAVAEKERVIEVERGEIVKAKSQLDQNLYIANGLLENQFKQLETEYGKRDWDRLRIEDPTEYAILKHEYAERRGRIDHEMRQLGSIYWQHQEELKRRADQTEQDKKQTQQQRQAIEKQKLYEQMPALKDKNNAEMYHKELVSYLEGMGVPAEKYNSEIFSEAWIFKILNDAMLYHRQARGDIKEKIQKAVAKQPRPAGRQAPDQKKVDRHEEEGLFNKFSQTKSAKDAAEWLVKRGFK